MKEIYSFKVNKMLKVQVEEQTAEGKLVKDVEKNTPIKIIFKKPSRLESESADTVSAVEYAESVRKGILTKPLLEKLYDEKGGFLVDDYEGKYNSLLGTYFELETEFQKLNFKEVKTPEDQNKLKELAGDFVKVQNSLQSIEAARNNLFQNTAETRAQNRTIFWLTLFLTYTQEDEGKEPIALFSGKTFEEKIAEYDNYIDEDNIFVYQVIQKMIFFVTLWYLGRASSSEDFKKIEENLNPQIEEETPVVAPNDAPVVQPTIAETPITPFVEPPLESPVELAPIPTFDKE